jgi:hypothetical protein
MLQAIKDVPIYAKTFKELCIKKPRRKQKEPLTIQVVGKLAYLMFEKTVMEKYVDPGNLIVTIFINNVPLYNTLIELGASINIMTVPTMEKLQLENL